MKLSENFSNFNSILKQLKKANNYSILALSDNYLKANNIILGQLKNYLIKNIKLECLLNYNFKLNNHIFKYNNNINIKKTIIDGTEIFLIDYNLLYVDSSQNDYIPIIGAWSQTIGCGDDSFDIISLASSLPRYYNDGDYNAFFSNGRVGNIQGWYENIYNNGKTYFLSIGGLNANSSGWKHLLDQLMDTKKLNNFMNACTCRNITGIDWDIENFDNALVEDIKKISLILKKNHFKIMYTILLGTPKWFKPLFDTKNDSYYDYVTLMLYNGGMYQKDGTGGGCDWDTWAELFLSNGKNGCTTPLNPNKNTYIQESNLQNINHKKIILGMRTDGTADNKFPATPEMVTRALDLLYKYKGAGIFFWDIGDAQNYSKLNNILQKLNRKQIKKTDCNVSWTTCKSYTKCTETSTCVTSFCYKLKMGGESHCEDCKENPSTWACNQPGYCVQKLEYPSDKCQDYISI